MSDKTCETCTYFVGHYSDKSCGSCYRYPPVPVWTGEETYSVNPTVSRRDGCGEWKEVE